MLLSVLVNGSIAGYRVLFVFLVKGMHCFLVRWRDKVVWFYYASFVGLKAFK